MTYLQKKKLAFMSLVNKVKGFVRTITGTPPLTLPDCVDGNSIINYTISGNSVQNGTPSSDNPIEIESFGEKTVNLFDVNNPYLIGGYVSNGKLIAYTSTINTKYNITIVLPIKPNTDYTVSRKILGARFNIGVSPSAPASDIEMTTYKSNYTAENLTIKSGENDTYLYVWFYNGGIDTYTYQELMQEIQIVEGSTASPYEPYGYKIPVKVSGKQLIPYPYYTKVKQYRGVDITYNKDGSLTLNGTYTHTSVGNYIVFLADAVKLPKGTYTISCEGATPVNEKGVHLIVTANGSYRHAYGGIKDTFTSNEDTTLGACYLQFAVSAVFDNVTVKPLIERGSEATKYEPYVEPIKTNIYLSEPIRKVDNSVGTYADYIDFENKKIGRLPFTKVLTGNENWTLRSNKTHTFQYWYGTTVNGGFCSHYEAISTNNFDVKNGIYLTNTGSFIISDLNCNSVAEFKAFLKAEYEKGTPVTIVTVKANATPTETDIDLPKLPTFKGTTIYSIETTVQPSNMSATYYSTSKGD